MKEKYFQQPSVMSAQAHFSKIPGAEIQRSRFDRSHAYKTTFNEGKIIPVFCDEVLPGDSFNMNATTFARLATPLKPIMDNMYLDMHFFFVPYRLVWENWPMFMGERPDPDFDPNSLTMPQRTITIGANGPTANTLEVQHYFGLPYVRTSGGAATYNVSALPFRAYNLIYNEWYRDQNLQDRRGMDKGDGPDTDDAELALASRGKRPDYFTTCLPWPQKGDPVVVPLGDIAPVISDGTQPTWQALGDDTRWREMVTQSGAIAGNPATMDGNGGAGAFAVGDDLEWRNTGLQADLSSATAVSINDLRSAFQIQRLLERDARGGTRYIELILSHFGVRSDDARLQRPEFLGGGTTRLNINPIAAMAGVSESAPQGNLAGVGTALMRDATFNKSFTEHGIILGLASIRADLTYQQGIDRMFSRVTRYDHYWPALAHLGEQAVLNKEIYFQSLPVDDDVFGYQERYAEYRYKQSRITGLFNSDAFTSIDVWHLAQDFESLPVLDSTFIEEQPPIDRIIAVPAEPHFIADIWFQLMCDRPMPVYSVPGLIDHF